MGTKHEKNAEEKTLGEILMTKIRNHSKRENDDRAGLTTEALAKSAATELKSVFSRLYWLEKKEGLLVSSGKGKKRVWRLSSRGHKSMLPHPVPPEA